MSKNSLLSQIKQVENKQQELVKIFDLEKNALLKIGQEVKNFDVTLKELKTRANQVSSEETEEVKKEVRFEVIESGEETKNLNSTESSSHSKTNRKRDVKAQEKQVTFKLNQSIFQQSKSKADRFTCAEANQTIKDIQHQSFDSVSDFRNIQDKINE